VILAGLGATGTEAEFILAKIEASARLGDPAEYLLGQIGKGNGDRLMTRARRALARLDRQADDDPDTERRRQHDGLVRFEREHPEARP
jgi:hypothetical protein